MSSGNSERRSQKRISAQVPVSVRSDGKEPSPGQARDLSLSGIFLYTERPFSPGSELELVLTLPPELLGSERNWVCCRARVVRVEEGDENGRFGVAANISHIATLPEIQG